MKQRVAILGAGPIGLEAALEACARGASVTVLEQGEIGAHPRAWGHVRCFTPWRMNVGPRGRQLVALPETKTEVCPTGAELVEEYLAPLARALAGRALIHTNTRVLGVSRRGTNKGDLLGDPARAAHPFRIVVAAAGVERALEADVVLDCAGTYAHPNALGDGGIPAPGERASHGRIRRHLDDVWAGARAVYVGKRVLLVGGGHSAMTSACALARLAQAEPATRVVWVTRATRVEGAQEDDPLAERAALVRRAARLASEGASGFVHRGGWVIDQLTPKHDGLRVGLRERAGEGHEPVEVDVVLANVGYGPDPTLYEELQIHECYASRGPMALAAALLGAAGGGGGDCLATPSFGASTLRNPEPGFFILGQKSYGRRADFLLATGYAQVRQVFELLEG